MMPRYGSGQVHGWQEAVDNRVLLIDACTWHTMRGCKAMPTVDLQRIQIHSLHNRLLIRFIFYKSLIDTLHFPRRPHTDDDLAHLTPCRKMRLAKQACRAAHNACMQPHNYRSGCSLCGALTEIVACMHTSHLPQHLRASLGLCKCRMCGTMSMLCF